MYKYPLPTPGSAGANTDRVANRDSRVRSECIFTNLTHVSGASCDRVVCAAQADHEMLARPNAGYIALFLGPGGRAVDAHKPACFSIHGVISLSSQAYHNTGHGVLCEQEPRIASQGSIQVKRSSLKPAHRSIIHGVQSSALFV